MTKENAIWDDAEFDEENINLDSLVNHLENSMVSHLSDLELMEDDRKMIGNPERLGKIIEETVMAQINNQIGVLASEEFIENNHGQTFDPRNSAHIQTTENFKEGKIATHNHKINYQERHDDWQSNFQKDDNGNIVKKRDPRSNTDKEVLTKDARKPFDENRDKGSASVHKDHTISAAEIIRDPSANCHLSKEEQIAFANSNKNLNDMDSAANQSKGDSRMDEFLESRRDGKKPSERFNIDEEKCREDDRVAREEYENQKKAGEKKSIETGKQSQKEEIGKIASSTAKAVGAQLVIALLKDLLKEITRKLVAWFKSAGKSIETFLDSLKGAIKTFAIKLKSEFSRHLKNSGSTAITTIVSAIFKPIGKIVLKFGSMIKQGVKSVKEAIDYLRSPANKIVPFSIKIAQIGKIAVAGFTAAGAIIGGTVIESGLSAIPVLGQVLAFPIPLVGSLASIIGLFMGALVAGVIGAMLLNFIDRFIAKRLKEEATKQKITKGNKILQTTDLLLAVKEKKLQETKEDVYSAITTRHKLTSDIVKDSLTAVSENNKKIVGLEEKAKSSIVISDNKEKFETMSENLNDL